MAFGEADPAIEVEVDKLWGTLRQDQFLRPAVLPLGLSHPGDHTSEPKSADVSACAVNCLAPFLLRSSSACAPNSCSQLPRTDGAARHGIPCIADP